MITSADNMATGAGILSVISRKPQARASALSPISAPSVVARARTISGHEGIDRLPRSHYRSWVAVAPPPVSSHFDLRWRCFAGKHVLVEKPITRRPSRRRH
jgi:hypothetical protein